MSQILKEKSYLTFPFQISGKGPLVSKRVDHVREQIEQVLFTSPGERVFRRSFGAGAKTLVFEPNDSALWEVVRKRLSSSLMESLKGEVDPKKLNIEVSGDEEKLYITISYTLLAIGLTDNLTVAINRRG
jgi:hypothetical protein